MGDVLLSILWHQHQPFYRDGPDGRYAMPWVRLHAIKDYYGMAWLALQHPGVHLTFNLVPSLLVQLEDYAEGRADEQGLSLTAKPAEELDPADVAVILREFFRANWDTMVRPHPRYAELLALRDFERETAEDAARRFSRRDLRDLQVWATLAWFFPQLLWDDPVLRGLVSKGRDFTEDDKAAMLAKQQEVLAQVVGMHRALQDRGSAEISLSPFYHPILPLLCNMERVHEGMPGAPLPRHRADLTADARAQVARAVELYERVFERAPRGMWPSEGSVSPEVVELAAQAGLRWIATDEGVLARSLGRTFPRDADGRVRDWRTLYQPYRAVAGHAEVAVIFRDHVLSDRLGFHYYHQAADQAAGDLVRRLQAIGAQAGRRDAFVSIILDGENAWEHYRDSGIHFFNALYERLAATRGLHTVTVSDYLDAHPPTATLPRLHSGSWINSDFRVWIGHEEDLRAWDALAQTRRFLLEHANGSPASPAAAAAWQEIYVAEGSDWFWWYGEDRSSPQDADFDRLFRGHLKNVYRLLGAEPPPNLDDPIARVADRVAYTLPSGFTRLRVDGRRSDYFEWLAAGLYRRELDAGVMDKQTPDVVRRVYFGFTERELCLRVDTAHVFAADAPAAGRLEFSFTEPRVVALEVSGWASGRPRVAVDGAQSPGASAAADRILEVTCPFDELGFRPRDRARFHVNLFDRGELVERAPRVGTISFEVPTRDFELEMWSV